MRRVQSIALVHETLSVSIDEAVDFDEIVDRLLVMLADVHGLGATGSRCAGTARSARSRPRWRRRWCWCSPSWCRTRSSTRFPDERRRLGDGRRRRAHAANCGCWCATTASGLPEDFTATASDRLGLQIVRTLVTAELDGTVELQRRRDRPGTSPRSRCRCGAAPASAAERATR